MDNKIRFAIVASIIALVVAGCSTIKENFSDFGVDHREYAVDKLVNRWCALNEDAKERVAEARQYDPEFVVWLDSECSR